MIDVLVQRTRQLANGVIVGIHAGIGEARRGRVEAARGAVARLAAVHAGAAAPYIKLQAHSNRLMNK